MAAEHRRVIAETPAHARAVAQNLARQEFVVETETADEWTLRKKRLRGDITVTILIRQPDQPDQPGRPGQPGRPLTTPPRAVPPSPWGPPAGPPAG